MYEVLVHLVEQQKSEEGQLHQTGLPWHLQELQKMNLQIQRQNVHHQMEEQLQKMEEVQLQELAAFDFGADIQKIHHYWLVVGLGPRMRMKASR